MQKTKKHIVPIGVYNNIQLYNHLYHFTETLDTIPITQLSPKQINKLKKIHDLYRELSNELYKSFSTCYE